MCGYVWVLFVTWAFVSLVFCGLCGLIEWLVGSWMWHCTIFLFVWFVLAVYSDFCVLLVLV